MSAPIEQREPAVITGLIMGVATCLLNLVVVLNIVELDPEQRSAILAAGNSLAVLVTAILIRNKVYAPATVARMVEDA